MVSRYIPRNHNSLLSALGSKFPFSRKTMRTFKFQRSFLSLSEVQVPIRFSPRIKGKKKKVFDATLETFRYHRLSRKHTLRILHHWKTNPLDSTYIPKLCFWKAVRVFFGSAWRNHRFAKATGPAITDSSRCEVFWNVYNCIRGNA